MSFFLLSVKQAIPKACGVISGRRLLLFFKKKKKKIDLIKQNEIGFVCWGVPDML
jgi:hypothetical protein